MKHPSLKPVELWVVCLGAAFILLGAYFLRAPIRQAAKVQRGDSAAEVHKRLGKPDAVFHTTLELRESYLGPMDYVFTDWSGQKSDLTVDQLPDVKTRAEWFGYSSAGHLVYYDDTGVIDVYWGGT